MPEGQGEKKGEQPDGGLSRALGVEKVTVKDKNGKEWVLSSLDLEDVAEIETDCGQPINRWLATSTRVFIDVLWGLLRKNGLTAAEIEARKWKLTRKEVGTMFDGHQYEKIIDAVWGVMRNSGWLKDEKSEKGKGEGRPPEGAAPTGAP